MEISNALAAKLLSQSSSYVENLQFHLATLAQASNDAEREHQAEVANLVSERDSLSDRLTVAIGDVNNLMLKNTELATALHESGQKVNELFNVRWDLSGIIFRLITLYDALAKHPKVVALRDSDGTSLVTGHDAEQLVQMHFPEFRTTALNDLYPHVGKFREVKDLVDECISLKKDLEKASQEIKWQRQLQERANQGKRESDASLRGSYQDQTTQQAIIAEMTQTEGILKSNLAVREKELKEAQDRIAQLEKELQEAKDTLDFMEDK